jgi:hypothetical protein
MSFQDDSYSKRRAKDSFKSRCGIIDYPFHGTKAEVFATACGSVTGSGKPG